MKSLLCDSAKSCISGLSLSSANYFEAIELLKQRYGNPQMLISAYMKRFVKLQLHVIKNNNDVFGLRKLYDQVESSARNLKSLQMNTSGYGALLLPLLIEKRLFSLRQSIAKKFENHIWELPEMLKILKGNLEAKERSISVGSTYSETSPNRYPSSALYSGFKSFSKKFVFCDENHYPNRCVKITDPQARKRFLTSNGHCFICFAKSHVASSCNKIINLTNVMDITTFQFVPFLNQRIAHRLHKMDSLKILKVLPRLMIKILLQTTFQLIEIIF